VYIDPVYAKTQTSQAKTRFQSTQYIAFAQTRQPIDRQTKTTIRTCANGTNRPANAIQEKGMNIAIVGGGKRGLRLMEIIQRHSFQEIKPEIIAVADINMRSPAVIKAMEQGLFVTNNYRDFLGVGNIELIVELTGDDGVYNDIINRKLPHVRAISSRTAQLFWEIARVSTLQKKTDQELHETRAMYKTALNDLIQEEVMVINFDYRITEVNQAFLNKLGLNREDVIGHYCYEITHHQNVPCSGEHHPCPLVETLDTKKPFQTTHIHLDKNKNPMHYSISTYPLIEDNDIIGAVEISRDITADINLQKAMMQQEKLASVGRLSAGVAHEINNPLTTILTTALLVQEDFKPEDPIYEELEVIAHETLRCRKIVTSLLDFARQSEPHKKKHNLNDVIHQSVLLTRKQAAFNDIQVEYQPGENIPQLMLDKGQIQQTLINLIINATEATGEGGRIVVTTAYGESENSVRITISDNGPGIDTENLDRIFDPFFTTKENGTGLGLAITHGIIEQHGGSIAVESQTGQGTRFIISLPLEGNSHDGD
jgi:two-component system, NtrC family, sensor kinase